MGYVVEPKGLAGRRFRRREPTGQADDQIIVVGAMTVGREAVDQRPALVIQCLEFGAIPVDEDGEDLWDSATIPYEPLADFAAEYREMDEAEVALFRAEQQVVSREATDARADRESPWAYVARNERRTGGAKQ